MMEHVLVLSSWPYGFQNNSHKRRIYVYAHNISQALHIAANERIRFDEIISSISVTDQEIINKSSFANPPETPATAEDMKALFSSNRSWEAAE